MSLTRAKCLTCLCFCLLAGCGSDDSSSDGKNGGGAGFAGDPGETGGASGDGGSGASATGGTSGMGGTSGSGGSAGQSPFDPNDPGMRIILDMGNVLMMGQPTGLAAGAFMQTAREDFDEKPDTSTIALGTCQATEAAYSPTCSGPSDCAPEQQCLPETDNSGNAIPNSERCVTARGPVDVGPFTLTGFATGPKVLAYNSGQNGAYTPAGSDGTVPIDEFAFDVTYSFEGEGSPAQGLGPFSGELHLSPALNLTKPEMIDLPIGFPGIQVDVNQDLELVWTGSKPNGELKITLTGASVSESHTITCRVPDTGSFTIPAAMVKEANLGNMAFLNTLLFERTDVGTASGQGLTSHEVLGIHTIMLNVAKVQ